MKKYEFEYFVKEVKKPKRLLSFLISKKKHAVQLARHVYYLLIILFQELHVHVHEQQHEFHPRFHEQDSEDQGRTASDLPVR